MSKKKSTKKENKKEDTHQKYDRAFQALFEEFREDIGITSKKDYQLDEKWQYKRPDTIIILEDNFDYTTLKDKTFPCLKEWNVIEFKSCKENLNIEDIPKYIANGNLLSRQMLLHRKGTSLNSIKDYVALIMVSSGRVSEDIISNFEQSEFRKGFYIFTGNNYFPVYMVIIEELEVIKPNYPLLLLGSEEKQEELWRQLIKGIKKDLNANNIEQLWKYMNFSIKRNIFKLKEGEVMADIRELSEEEESINRLFNDEFLGRILAKKGDEFLGKILQKKEEESINRIFDDEFLTRLVLKKIRKSADFKKKIQQELKNEFLEK